MHLICDVDDVLLNWMDGFKAFLDKEKIPHKEGVPKEWDMTDWMYNVDYVPIIEQFNMTKEFGELKPIDGAVEALKWLFDHGFSIYAVTSCTTEYLGVTRRTKNLHAYFGEIFEEIMCLPLGAKKNAVLKRYPRGTHYVEDNHSHAVRGLEVGLKPIILDREHNIGLYHPEVARCEDWKQVWRLICKDYKKVVEVKYGTSRNEPAGDSTETEKAE